MSASGSTPHLHLSQYNDTDHPSYVSDYTEDMGRIDTGFNLAALQATVDTIPSAYMPLNPTASAFDPPSHH